MRLQNISKRCNFRKNILMITISIYLLNISWNNQALLGYGLRFQWMRNVYCNITTQLFLHHFYSICARKDYYRIKYIIQMQIYMHTLYCFYFIKKKCNWHWNDSGIECHNNYLYYIISFNCIHDNARHDSHIGSLIILYSWCKKSEWNV